MRTHVAWAALLIVSGCAGVGGNGEPADRSIPIDVFTTLAVSDALVVDLSLGAPSASIRGEGGLVERIDVRRRGLRLEVSVKDDVILDPDIPMQIRLTTPGLVQVEATESSVVNLNSVLVPELTLISREGSQVRARGAVARLAVHGATASDVDARGMEADDVDVVGAGASTIAIMARRSVRGSLTDHSELVVLGGGSVDGVELEHDAVLRREP